MVGKNHKWEHAPEVMRSPYPVPRAAFGLPILMHFKDRKDEAANGRISNKTDRFTSPLRFRPVRFASGKITLLVIAFSHRPADTTIQIKGGQRISDAGNDEFSVCPSNVLVMMSGSVVGEYLDKSAHSPRDAVRAFCLWLRTQGFELLGASPSPKGGGK